MKKNSRIPFVIWSIVFIILPILIILYYSITLSDGTFSLDNYKVFFEKGILKVVLRSIQTALISTVICLILGYPLAFFMNRVSKKAEKFLLVLLILPMWMNFLLRTYAWQSILGKNGFVNSLFGIFGLGPFHIMFTEYAVILVMVYNFLPFMVLPIYTVIKKIDSNVIEAAEDLGANHVRIFRKVILPLSIPGIVSGITMTFLPALSSFVIPDLVGGGKVSTIGNLIEKQFLLLSDWHLGSALSMVLVLMILVSIPFTGNDNGEGLW